MEEKEEKVRKKEENQMGTHRNLKATFGGGVGDVLSGNVADAPKKAGADDLSLHRMIRQAILVPFPHPRHHLFSLSKKNDENGRERERGMNEDTTKLTSSTNFENPFLYL